MAAKKKGESGRASGSASDAASGRAVRRGKRGGRAGAPGDNASPAPRDGRRASDVSDDLYVAESGIHGTGMFAAGPLAAGVSLGRLAGMPTHDDGTYVLWLTDELGLEVTNDFRFINHDGDPNCELTDVDVVTLRALAVDEELTHDYGW